MSTVPLVSIVLPVYNGEHFIRDAIHTILAQDFSQFELIIINDGSTDNTERTVSEISDPRIKLINFHSNQGVGFARNAGVELARGEFIALADADDHWKQNKLSLQLEAMIQHPQIDIIFSEFTNVNQITGVIASGFSQTQAGLDTCVICALSDTTYVIRDKVLEGLLTANFIQASSMVIRKEVFNRIGNFNKALPRACDYELTLRAAMAGHRFAFQLESLVIRYKTPHSVTSNVETFIPQYVKALDEFIALCSNTHRSDLILLVNRKKQSVWCTQIRHFARTGDRRQAWHAFRQCLNYGISFRAIAYMGAALAGPRFIQLIKG